MAKINWQHLLLEVFFQAVTSTGKFKFMLQDTFFAICKKFWQELKTWSRQRNFYSKFLKSVKKCSPFYTVCMQYSTSKINRNFVHEKGGTIGQLLLLWWWWLLLLLLLLYTYQYNYFIISCWESSDAGNALSKTDRIVSEPVQTHLQREKPKPALYSHVKFLYFLGNSK